MKYQVICYKRVGVIERDSLDKAEKVKKTAESVSPEGKFEIEGGEGKMSLAVEQKIEEIKSSVKKLESIRSEDPCLCCSEEMHVGKLTNGVQEVEDKLAELKELIKED